MLVNFRTAASLRLGTDPAHISCRTRSTPPLMRCTVSYAAMDLTCASEPFKNFVDDSLYLLVTGLSVIVLLVWVLWSVCSGTNAIHAADFMWNEHHPV